MKTQKVCIFIDPALVKVARILAIKEGISLSKFVERLIKAKK